MKKILMLLCAALAFGLAGFCQAGTLTDDFSDGNTKGWLASFPKANYGTGNWRLEDGLLRQDLAGDHYKLLLKDFFVSTQTAEAKMSFNGQDGYGGITIWYKDADNWVDILAYPGYAGKGLQVIEKISGSSKIYDYHYSYKKETWYRLRIDANGANGKIKVYMDDVYLFTHDAETGQRAGLSGLNSGNSGGYFDDFKLTSSDVHGLIANDGKSECKKGGWRSWADRSFKNQGQCVSQIASFKKTEKNI